MKVFLFLSIFIACIFNTYAEDAYPRKWNMNLWHENGGIMPFHTGGTFCDKRNKIWSEKCQDALLEDVYGNVWPEVKQVILAFQKAVVENDYRYLIGKTVMPKEKLAVFVQKYKYVKTPNHDKYMIDATDRFYITTIQNLNKLFFNKFSNKLRATIKNIKYEDLIIDDEVGFGAHCSIMFKIIAPNSDLAYEDHVFHYIPKISLVSLDFMYFQWDEIFLSEGY